MHRDEPHDRYLEFKPIRFRAKAAEEPDPDSTHPPGRKSRRMISLKKYLDRDSDELLTSTLAAYRSALLSMAECSVAGYPSTSHELQQELVAIESRLSGMPAPEVMADADKEVCKRLEQWGERTAHQLRQTTQEVKSLLLTLAGTAEAVGERDQHYAEQFVQLTNHLEAISELDDLSRIRASVLESAAKLRERVSAMARDSTETVTRFKSQLASYEERLQESEQRTVRDSLTHLYNRRGVEKVMIRRIGEKRAFSAVMIDLDDFKKVNDLYGHMAGDELLKQFADELRFAARSTDIPGRWGGDEFILILDCGLDQAKALLNQMDRWVFGDYEVTCGAEIRKVSMNASTGVAEWRPGETLHQVLARADAAMYLDKARDRRLDRRKKQQAAPANSHF